MSDKRILSVRVGENGSERAVRKADPIVVTVREGDKQVQFEFNSKEVRLTGDGGEKKARCWEIDLAVPRVGE